MSTNKIKYSPRKSKLSNSLWSEPRLSPPKRLHTNKDGKRILIKHLKKKQRFGERVHLKKTIGVGLKSNHGSNRTSGHIRNSKRLQVDKVRKKHRRGTSKEPMKTKIKKKK